VKRKKEKGKREKGKKEKGKRGLAFAHLASFA